MIRVAACSYEGSIFGWKVENGSDQIENSKTSSESVASGKKKDKKRKATQVEEQSAVQTKVELQFGLHVTHGSLKAIAVSKSGRYLAVGGMTERICLYNMQENKEIGEISGHEGAITSLAFFEDNFIISGSEDFTLNVWRVHDRELLQRLGGHKDVVFDFAIHPTGKLALSISKDHTMKLWNLVQGRCSFTRRLKTLADFVMWNPQGTYYLLATQKAIQLFDINNNNDCKLEISSSSRINHVVFVAPRGSEQGDDGLRVAVICDNNTISLYNLSGALTASLNLKSVGVGRLRSLTSFQLPVNADGEENGGIVIVTSTGCVVVLNTAALEQAHSEEQEQSQEESKNKEEKGEDLSRDELIFGKALVAFHQIKAEPRLTAVCAWTVTDKTTSVINETPVEIANNLNENVSNEIEEIENVEDEDVNEKKRKSKKVGFVVENKKKKAKK
eukprot:gene5695-6121_t